MARHKFRPGNKVLQERSIQIVVYQDFVRMETVVSGQTKSADYVARFGIKGRGGRVLQRFDQCGNPGFDVVKKATVVRGNTRVQTTVILEDYQEELSARKMRAFKNEKQAITAIIEKMGGDGVTWTLHNQRWEVSFWSQTDKAIAIDNRLTYGFPMVSEVRIPISH